MSSDNHPLRIRVLFHNVLIEKIPSTMRIEVQNLLDVPLQNVSVMISSTGMEPIHWSAPKLECWKCHEQALQVIPRAEGVYVASIHSEAQTKNGDHYQGIGWLRTEIEVLVPLKFPASGDGGIVIPFPPKNVSHGERVFEEVDLTWQHTPADEEVKEATEEERTPSSSFWPGDYGEWSRIPGTHTYFMRTQVSQRLWEGIMHESLERWLKKREEAFASRRMSMFGPEMPAFGITHAEARQFCEKLTAYAERNHLLPHGWVFRLPTVSEWRIACGEIPSAPVEEWWYNLSLPAYAHRKEGPLPVLGSNSVQTLLKPNNHGLYAMLGNLFEWCALESGGGSGGYGSGNSRVAPLLGGSWHPREDINHRNPHSGYIATAPVGRRSSRFGFRPVAIKYQKLQ